MGLQARIASSGGRGAISVAGVLAVVAGLVHACWPIGLLMWTAGERVKGSDFKDWRLPWVIVSSLAQILLGLLIVAGGIALMKQRRSGRALVVYPAITLIGLNITSLVLRYFNYPARIKKDVGFKDIFRYNGVYWWFDHDYNQSWDQFIKSYNTMFAIQVVAFSALMLLTTATLILVYRTGVPQVATEPTLRQSPKSGSRIGQIARAAKLSKSPKTDRTTVIIHKSGGEARLAPWHVRAGAFAIDVLPAMTVVTTMLLVFFTVPLHSAWWWICLSVGGVVFLLMLVNRLLLPVVTGWSLGRAFCGIAVLRRDGSAPGAWTLLLRDVAHLLDTASLLVGWLWPLWDPDRRTFADMLVGTEVHRVEHDRRPRNIGRWTALAVLIAAALCMDGARVSYAVVYTQQQATDRTRAEIAVQGPKMVAQMLTYDPKSLQQDFDRALSLATDKYRPQLAHEQDVVRKGQPVVNEYWATDGAIQSAGPDWAKMLVFLHGRRGDGADQRYITAGVRVAFVKGADGRWRVDDLTVLSRPKPPREGR